MDNLPLRVAPWILPIHAVIDKDQKRRSDEAAAKSKAEGEAEANKHR